MENETLERCTEKVYEHITARVCASPAAPPGILAVPWRALPASLQQAWREAVALGLAEASKGSC